LAEHRIPATISPSSPLPTPKAEAFPGNITNRADYCRVRDCEKKSAPDYSQWILSDCLSDCL